MWSIKFEQTRKLYAHIMVSHICPCNFSCILPNLWKLKWQQQWWLICHQNAMQELMQFAFGNEKWVDIVMGINKIYAMHEHRLKLVMCMCVCVFFLPADHHRTISKINYFREMNICFAVGCVSMPICHRCEAD